jgi:plasmid stabilization system protein ParE
LADYYLTREARNDLQNILDYIADDSIEAALKVHSRFLEIFNLLAENPEIGHFRSDLTTRPVRLFPVYSYLVVYLADSHPAQIVRVLGGAQDLESILG